MSYKIPLDLINKNLEEAYKERLTRNKDGAYSKEHNLTVPVSNGMVDSDYLGNLAKRIAEKNRENPSDVFRKITKKPDFLSIRKPNLEKLTLPLLIIFSLILVISGISKLTPTGNIIGSSATTNASIILCIIGIIAILIYRDMKKRF